MILSKSFLDAQVRANILKENFVYGGLLNKREERKQYDVFISYSWGDKLYADKVVQLLERCGYIVYIDYNDTRLDRANVSPDTAKRIIQEMLKCKGLLYLYSPNSSSSKWCPWEVGVFSGIKEFRCANLPLLDKPGESFKNQEYLEIYPYVEYELDTSKYQYDFMICESDTKSVNLKSWLSGANPREHR